MGRLQIRVSMMADGIGQAYFFVNILDIRPYVGAQFFFEHPFG